LKLGREIAEFLRKNIVQAERLQMQPGEETYSTCSIIFFTSFKAFIMRAEIRITEHTELGDNDTIKNPENMVEMPRRRRGKKENGVAVE
jgi:peptide chain release factor